MINYFMKMFILQVLAPSVARESVRRESELQDDPAVGRRRIIQ